MITVIKKGDLVIYSRAGGALEVGLYMGGDRSYQFWDLTQFTLDRIAAGKKPMVSYITGSYSSTRVIKVTPDVLDPEELRVYKELKGIKDEVTNGNKGSN